MIEVRPEREQHYSISVIPATTIESPTTSSAAPTNEIVVIRKSVVDKLKKLSVHEVNKLISLSLSLLLAAMLQTVHCVTVFMGEHIKNIEF